MENESLFFSLVFETNFVLGKQWLKHLEKNVTRT